MIAPAMAAAKPLRKASLLTTREKNDADADSVDMGRTSWRRCASMVLIPGIVEKLRLSVVIA
jgi:hypothetical protein